MFTPTPTPTPTSTPDTVPPAVSLTYPPENQTLSSTITVVANASDDVAVAGVQFQVDSSNIGIEDTTAPYTADFDTTTVADGTHLVTAVARDTATNSTTSTAVSITVNNTNRPNIVFILTDDQRLDSIQHMPLLNARLGNESVQFTNGFVSTPLCCPSRSTILTGLYSHNHGVLTNGLPDGGATKFDPSSTLPVWLKQTGYKTGLFGKYMNEYNLISPAIPPGWSQWYAFVKPNNKYYYNYTINDNGVIISFGSTAQSYSTDVIATKAAQFIDTTPTNGQPLFIYFTPHAPHAPVIPGPGDSGSFSWFPNWRPPSYNEADVSDKPLWVQQLPLFTSSVMSAGDNLHRKQLESLQSVDRAISSIMDALERTGRLSNTIVIFTSDNGLSWGEHRWMNKKSCPYEECIRVPFWVRVPGVATRIDTSLIQNIDFAPTIADWAGVQVPTAVNGLNFSDLMTNPQTPWRSEILLEQLGTTDSGPNFQSVRNSQYIYTEYPNGDRELYDLLVDPYQLTNIVTDPAYAGTVTQMQGLLNSLKDS